MPSAQCPVSTAYFVLFRFYSLVAHPVPLWRLASMRLASCRLTSEQPSLPSTQNPPYSPPICHYIVSQVTLFPIMMVLNPIPASGAHNISSKKRHMTRHF